MKIREDFRRDGLSANFLVDGPMMTLVARAFPGCILNVGYPSVCTAEREQCVAILESLKGHDVEPALYAHARWEHLELVGTMLADHPHGSVCYWLPTSRKFIGNTLRKDPDQVVEDAVQLAFRFKKCFPHALDIALADTTLDEVGLPERIADMTYRFHEAGIRSVIVADTRGIATQESIGRLFACIRARSSGAVEFHAHCDNGMATTLGNVAVARSFGVECINTAIFHSSERATLIDPRDLLEAGHAIDFVTEYLAAFETEYRRRIGDPYEITRQVYGPNVIATGSQYRLRDRFTSASLVFGMTSDKYILGKLLGVPTEQISDARLNAYKCELYRQRKIFFTADELRWMEK